MKRVSLLPITIKEKTASVVPIYQDFLGAAPVTGVTIAAIRARVRTMDKIAAVGSAPYVDLEDEDHATLLGVLTTGSFSAVDRGLIEAVERVERATEPPPVVAEARVEVRAEA